MLQCREFMLCNRKCQESMPHGMKCQTVLLSRKNWQQEKCRKSSFAKVLGNLALQEDGQRSGRSATSNIFEWNCKSVIVHRKYR